MIDEATSLREEAAELLRSIHGLVGVSAPLLFALGTLTFVDRLRWAATTGPVLFAGLSFYLIDVFVEAAYLGGNRALIERRVGEMLGATPGHWSVTERVWDTPMVWETRIVPDRLRAPSRIGMGLLWMILFIISLGFATDALLGSDWSAFLIVLYYVGIGILTAGMAASIVRLSAAHSRGELLAARDPEHVSASPSRLSGRIQGLFGSSSRWKTRSRDERQ